MNIDIIVQARMGSTRLPGKVLKPIMGRPMIEYTLESLLRCENVRGIVSAVPTGENELVKVCGRYGAVWTGPEKNVGARFVGAVRSRNPDAFIRICGDSPVIDWRMVDILAEKFSGEDCDIARSIGFPHGQQAEIVSVPFFLGNLKNINREHVTIDLYRRTPLDRQFGLFANMASTEPPLVVDTQEDFDRMIRVIERANGKPWEFTWRQLQDFARETCPNQSN